jgi:hypothetical protein
MHHTMTRHDTVPRHLLNRRTLVLLGRQQQFGACSNTLPCAYIGNPVSYCAPLRQTNRRLGHSLQPDMANKFNGKSTGDDVLQGQDLTGKVAVITGWCCQHQTLHMS